MSCQEQAFVSCQGCGYMAKQQQTHLLHQDCVSEAQHLGLHACELPHQWHYCHASCCMLMLLCRAMPLPSPVLAAA